MQFRTCDVSCRSQLVGETLIGCESADRLANKFAPTDLRQLAGKSECGPLATGSDAPFLQLLNSRLFTGQGRNNAQNPGSRQLPLDQHPDRPA